MSKVEFFRKSDNSPLPFDVEEERYVWHQYRDRGEWYLRVSDLSVTSAFIRVGTMDIPLSKYHSDDCFTLSKTDGEKVSNVIESLTGSDQNPGSWVALLDLWSSDGQQPPQKLFPSLYIEPAYLGREDFKQLIQRIQELAFFRYSPTQVKVVASGGSGERGIDNDRYEQLHCASVKFLQLIKQVESDWPLVQSAASRETQLAPKLVDVSSAAGSYSCRLVAKVAQHPYARRVEILMPQETLATVENRFLAFVLQEIAHKSPLFEKQLELCSGELRENQVLSKDKNFTSRQRIPQWQKKREQQEALAGQMTELANDITKAARTVAHYTNDAILREVRDSPKMPNTPTDRLTRSLAYGSIYEACISYRDQPGISFAPLKPGLLQAFDAKPIHPACTLYELWVFVELYDMLIRTFGFRPLATDNVGHPFDYIDGEAGEVVGNALKNKDFSLELRPTGSTNRVITITLTYDSPKKDAPQEWRNLRPDVLMNVSDSKSGKKAFAIDAKYHSYPGYYMKPELKKHEVDTVFDLDLLFVAKTKYFERLGCNAAFIVHPDQNDEYTYWGGVHHKSVSGNKKNGPEHHYGSVFARPTNTSNFRRLLKCFLMYHMDIENICWSCKTEVEAEQILFSGKIPVEQYDKYGYPIGTELTDVECQPVARSYRCGGCQSYWQRTWCPINGNQGGHKIYKIGIDNFHSSSGTGFAICAKCGNGSTESKISNEPLNRQT